MSATSARPVLGSAWKRAYARLPLPGIRMPVFVVECGRSGTTILGQSLACHPRVTYLNEPRELWRAAFPRTDVWSADAERLGGRLTLGAEDADATRARQLSRAFRLESLLQGKLSLVEKLPINCFRQPFLHALFPDARFVFIHRCGLEVAASIASLAKSGGWFGAGGYKWRRLVERAEASEATRDLPRLCEDDFDRGLLEWRLANEAIADFLRRFPAERCCTLGYDELTEEQEPLCT